jgi:hypothetical protein
VQRLDEVSGELKEREKEVLKRDRLITELRLRMPADSQRDEIIRAATATTTTAAPGTMGASQKQQDEDYESQQAVRVAQSTVTSLQVSG